MLKPEHFIVALNAALEAGSAILEVYKEDFPVEFKKDNSPLTLADKNAHDVIVKALGPLGYPILSEEGKTISFEERGLWKEFWLVDPLDGTKEFIKRNGEFTVNIAFIQDGKAIAGIIFAPVLKKLWFAKEETGSRYIDISKVNDRIFSWDTMLSQSVILPLDNNKLSYVVASSVSHLNEETREYIDKAVFGKDHVEYLQVGSSLKFCSLAEGQVDLYPRLGPTMEWDTAAGHAIAELSGCKVIEYPTGIPLRYNKPSLLNPWFVAGRDI